MTVPPIRREVVVETDPDRAFRLFTAHIGAWWPVADFGVFGGTVSFEGSELVERSGERAAVCAEVTAWEPPHRLALAWHAGRSVDEATEVSVSFVPHEDGTLVSLVHGGWERLAEPQRAAEEYGHGWPVVLDAFGAVVPDRWFVLLHRPGPAVPAGESVFAQPAFGEHVAFLGRLAERGLLVAAGPLTDEDGAGMTLLRVRAEDAGADLRALATTDDASVAGGLLTVTVRPWQVLSGELAAD